MDENIFQIVAEVSHQGKTKEKAKARTKAKVNLSIEDLKMHSPLRKTTKTNST